MGKFKRIPQSLFLTSLLFLSVAQAEEKADPQIYSAGEKEFREKTVKLKALESKIAESDLLFASLVQQKNKSQSKSEALSFIEQMKEIKVERDKDLVSFNKLRQELIYKFPDKGRTVMRKYAPIHKKTLKQLEKKSSLDKDLTRARKKAAQVYRPFVKEAERKEELKKERMEKRALKRRAKKQSDIENPGQPKKLKLEK